MEDENDYRLIYLFIILITVGIMIAAIYIMVSEIREARTECHNINGTYELKFTQLKHFCNDKLFEKYSYCIGQTPHRRCGKEWRFEFNMTEMINEIKKSLSE